MIANDFVAEMLQKYENSDEKLGSTESEMLKGSTDGISKM